MAECSKKNKLVKRICDSAETVPHRLLFGISFQRKWTKKNIVYQIILLCDIFCAVQTLCFRPIERLWLSLSTSNCQWQFRWVCISSCQISSRKLITWLLLHNEVVNICCLCRLSMVIISRTIVPFQQKEKKMRSKNAARNGMTSIYLLLFINRSQ